MKTSTPESADDYSAGWRRIPESDIQKSAARSVSSSERLAPSARSRGPCRRPLEDGVRIGLDHPDLIGSRRNEDVEGGPPKRMAPEQSFSIV